MTDKTLMNGRELLPSLRMNLRTTSLRIRLITMDVPYYLDWTTNEILLDQNLYLRT